jgi:polysulfide reductase chain C
MNNIWGSTAQYDVINWPWPIAIYLFLAGMSAGSIMVSLLVKWNRHETNNPNIWDAIVKSGAVLAPTAIILGLLLLIVDLGKPLHFYLLLFNYNWSSVMTIGVVAISFYTPVVLMFMLLTFEDTVKKQKILGPLVPIIAYIKKFSHLSKTIEYVLFGLAIVIAVYTGFLLSAVSSIPLWNSPILPLLFLTSSFSSGIAANILLSITVFKGSVNKENIKRLLIVDLRVILTEIPLLILLFVGMNNMGGEPALAAKQALHSWLLWIGVVGVGLLTPLIIALTALKNHAYKVRFIIIDSLAVLLGVIMLRYYIVYTGQLFTGI